MQFHNSQPQSSTNHPNSTLPATPPSLEVAAGYGSPPSPLPVPPLCTPSSVLLCHHKFRPRRSAQCPAKPHHLLLLTASSCRRNPEPSPQLCPVLVLTPHLLSPPPSPGRDLPILSYPSITALLPVFSTVFSIATAQPEAHGLLCAASPLTRFKSTHSQVAVAVDALCRRSQ
ncbi:hypothetical protein M0R45_026222 [Rubus argutus]|uniref:Uncharacterized protein n=1 Tax=Rubus argutus TaxID=59490 RepID=A0AAW1WZ75_RUBAR